MHFHHVVLITQKIQMFEDAYVYGCICLLFMLPLAWEHQGDFY